MRVTNTSLSARPEPVDAMRRRMPDDVQVALDAAEQGGHEVRVAPTHTLRGRAGATVEVFGDERRFSDALLTLLWRAGFSLRPTSRSSSGPQYDHAIQTVELK